jgi:hypothetical protein
MFRPCPDHLRLYSEQYLEDAQSQQAQRLLCKPLAHHFANPGKGNASFVIEFFGRLIQSSEQRGFFALGHLHLILRAQPDRECRFLFRWQFGYGVLNFSDGAQDNESWPEESRQAMRKPYWANKEVREKSDI